MRSVKEYIPSSQNQTLTSAGKIRIFEGEIISSKFGNLSSAKCSSHLLFISLLHAKRNLHAKNRVLGKQVELFMKLLLELSFEAASLCNRHTASTSEQTSDNEDSGTEAVLLGKTFIN